MILNRGKLVSHSYYNQKEEPHSGGVAMSTQQMGVNKLIGFLVNKLEGSE